jgi:hypothetical protein
MNALGFVWTDGFDRGELGLGPVGNGQGACFYESLMDNANTGETAEDVFVGFISDEEFTEAQFSIRSRGFGPIENVRRHCS